MLQYMIHNKESSESLIHPHKYCQNPANIILTDVFWVIIQCKVGLITPQTCQVRQKANGLSLFPRKAVNSCKSNRLIDSGREIQSFSIFCFLKIFLNGLISSTTTKKICHYLQCKYQERWWKWSEYWTFFCSINSGDILKSDCFQRFPLH